MPSPEKGHPLDRRKIPQQILHVLRCVEPLPDAAQHSGRAKLVEVGVQVAAAHQVLPLDLARVQTKAPRQAEAREMVQIGHSAKPQAAYIENELPQPQVPLACGLVMLKPRLFRSSWK